MANEQRPLVYYIAASLDGYIAKQDGNLDWLYENGRSYTGYQDVYRTMDAIIMGRSTYDWILANGEWSYDKKCYVFTHRTDEPKHNVEFVSGDVSEFMGSLRRQGGSRVWLMGGSDLAGTFIRANLVDEFIITIIPVIVGSGIPLFREYNPFTKLTLKEIKRFDDIVELHYATKRD